MLCLAKEMFHPVVGPKDDSDLYTLPLSLNLELCPQARINGISMCDEAKIRKAETGRGNKETRLNLQPQPPPHCRE
jgi:hypothetical protein